MIPKRWPEEPTPNSSRRRYDEIIGTRTIDTNSIRNIKLILRLSGLVLVAAHFVSHPLNARLFPIVLYMVIFVSVIVTHVFGVKPIVDEIKRARRRQTARQYIDQEKQEIAGRFDTIFRNALQRPLLNLTLAIGEDGVLLVPLLWFGVNPASALIAAAAFGMLHYPAFTSLQCVSKGIAYYFACLLVLPHGLLNMLAGHLILDGIMLTMARKRIKRMSSAN